MKRQDTFLEDWRQSALNLELQVKGVIVGQERVVRLLTIAVFARGHVLLEGDVGVGKTTLLRALARGIGGAYERIEGTIDLMPNDLVYYTYVSEDGKPRVDRGPLLKHDDALSIFFFNEINRARPQVHSLMLRVMAERSVSAFDREFRFPHLQVFADRNRVEKDETFEIPPAARDRFLMEVPIEMPADPSAQHALMFEQRFHDPDKLIAEVDSGVLDYRQLNDVSAAIQERIVSTQTLQRYALDLCRATHEPASFGIAVDGYDFEKVIQAGVSPRGMSMLVRAAKVAAWLEGRDALLPEDLQGVYLETVPHRVFFTPVYELRRSQVAAALSEQILSRIAAP